MTLVEIVVALALLVIVLGTATTSLLRQQRTAKRVDAATTAESQLGAAAGMIGDLAGLSPAAGDLASGEARDTSLQVRSVVTVGVSCGAAVGSTVVDRVDVAAAGPADASSMPRVGDSLWWYTGGMGWTGRPIQDVRSIRGACRDGQVDTSATVRVGVGPADSVPAGAPLRVTRQLRYLFYHAGDGSVQLGLREWTEPAHELGGPQPLAGPFLARVSGGQRTGFRYFDAAGAELPPPVVQTDRIARIRIIMLAPDGGGSGAGAVRRESLDVATSRARAAGAP